MKQLFALAIAVLHVMGALAAIAGPKDAAAPKPVPVAQDIHKVNQSITVAKDQTAKNVTAVNGSVNVFGHVTGDATAVNGNVHMHRGSRIDGKATAVNGRVIQDPGAVLGNKLCEVNTETGKMPTGIGDVTIIGGQRAGREAVEVGDDVVVEKGQTVTKAAAVMGNLTVKGHVTGDAVAVMGNVYVPSGGKVDGDAVAVMGKVIRSGTGSIKGDVTSVGWGFPQTTWYGVPGWLLPSSTEKWDGWMLFLLYNAGGLVLSALLTAVVIALFPQRMSAIAETSIEKPGWSLLYGIAAALLVIPVAFLLLITCIGIPLIAVELVFVVMLVIAGSVAIELALGRKISAGIGRPIQSAVWAGVVGALVVGLIELIPFIGIMISLVLYTLGTGAALMTGFGSRPDWFASKFDKSSRPTAPQTPHAPPEPSQAPPLAPPTPPTEPPSGPVQGQ